MTVFVISFISLFDIINVVVRFDKSKRWSEPLVFFWIAESVADATAVNHNGVKTLLVNGLVTCLVKGKPILSNGPKSQPRNQYYSKWGYQDNFKAAYFFFVFFLRKDCEHTKSIKAQNN